MKKGLLCAIACALGGCYTPLNNSGVSTTQAWLEVPAKRVDFDGKQYDSCVQFNLRFWPQEAAQRLDLQAACVSSCCWRSDRDEITLDFNKNFQQELRTHGVARKYSPEKITLKVTHSNLVNVTKVTVSPRGAIKRSGLVKLDYTTVRDEKRLAQIEQELKWQEEMAPEELAPAVRPASTPKTAAAARPAQDIGLLRAKALVQRKVGTQIDTYFYRMDKTYRQKGALFMLGTRLYTAQRQEDGTYMVTCHANARTGVDEKHINPSDFPCGRWVADLATQMVLPDDAKAKQIMQ